MAGEWKLKIEFRDMFFLVLYRNDHGAVVLLPHKKHSAVLWIDDPQYSYGLYRSQVNLRDENGALLWNRPCIAPSDGNLVSANDIFGQFTVREDLLKEPVVPDDLNARVVLGGGRFTDLPARDLNSRFKWTFPGGQTAFLTDRLLYEVDMPEGDAFLTIKHHDLAMDSITIAGGSPHKLVIWNRDLRDTGQEVNLPPGQYELTEYDTLHALLGRDRRNPKGHYPMGLATGLGGAISNDEPICGGEQGDPNPPPPDPPGP